MITKEHKNILIPWSGGMDSTFLVYKALKEGNTVKAVYLDITNNELKPKFELEAIDKLRELLYKEFPGKFSFEIAGKMVMNNCGDILSFKQLPLWVLSIWYSIDSNTDEVQIGYVMKDDAISYIPDIETLYKGMSGMLLNSNVLPPLTFPLKKWKKTEIRHYLPSRYFDLTVWCESPNEEGEPCGTCTPCNRRGQELGQIYQANKRSLRVRETPSLDSDYSREYNTGLLSQALSRDFTQSVSGTDTNIKGSTK